MGKMGLEIQVCIKVCITSEYKRFSLFYEKNLVAKG